MRQQQSDSRRSATELQGPTTIIALVVRDLRWNAGVTQRKTQLAVLRWIGQGCAVFQPSNPAHRVSSAALRRRGLVKISGPDTSWSGSITKAARGVSRAHRRSGGDGAPSGQRFGHAGAGDQLRRSTRATRSSWEAGLISFVGDCLGCHPGLRACSMRGLPSSRATRPWAPGRSGPPLLEGRELAHVRQSLAHRISFRSPPSPDASAGRMRERPDAQMRLELQRQKPSASASLGCGWRRCRGAHDL